MSISSAPVTLISGRHSMALVFIGKDDTSRNGGSPAVLVDTDTKELVIQGYTETEPNTLQVIDSCSRTADNESSVRLPIDAHMAAVLKEALDVIGEPLPGSA